MITPRLLVASDRSEGAGQRRRWPVASKLYYMRSPKPQLGRAVTFPGRTL